MKLSRRIISSITVALLILFSLWALIFYQTSTRRIYGRIDRVLSQQSDKIISRFLENDSLPNSLSGISGTMEFFIEKVTPEYAQNHQTPVFQTDEDYIDDIHDEETVREMTRVFQKQGTNYELTLITQVFAWNDTLDFALFSILTLAIALLVAIIAIVSFIIIRNMRPLYRLTDWLRNRKANEAIPEPDSRIKVQEFKEIETAVLEASERSKQLFEEQKRFIGNASHEIQTPIAVCRNRLELLVDNTPLDESQLTEIEKTLDTLNYISRLNKSLLLLSKIDNHQFKEEVEVSVNQIANQALENLSEIYESLHIGVETEEKSTIIARMDPTLASSLVTNVLKNAFVHNKPGGSIRLELADNALSVSNTGASEALDEKAVFQTFYKKGQNAGSTGLGLAIVKAICNEYGFGVSYQFIENQHIFKVVFK
ncbi:MAG: HAMP domain-containing histidine kinase [Bacteroidales bacterium]|nr:HAMP domain-containing histidine kinase [Bacteroidales bacterium]